MKISLFNLIFIVTCFFQQHNLCFSQSSADKYLSGYNVVWDTPSTDYTGSMPLGNGDIGVNAWIEPSGDLVLYIGKTDSWDDNGRLVKVGRVRVSLTPKPRSPLALFTQTLNLEDATMRVRYGEGAETVELKLWVDANNPVIQIDINSGQPSEAVATNELWRTSQDVLPSIEISDVMFDWDKDNHQHAPTVIEPDSILTDQHHRIGWLHHNRKSVGPEMCAEIQGLSDFQRPDPLLHRTFGAVVTADYAEPADGKNLPSGPSKHHLFNIYVLTQHSSTPRQWMNAMEKTMARIVRVPYDVRRRAHVNWWKNFWRRSWIHVTPANPNDTTVVNDAFIVSRSYALQRFINACAGRGQFPIKFNGSIFTVPSAGQPGNADYRRWGPGYWWQNTRLPYEGMCTSGDFDMMQPLFKMYGRDLLPLFRYRTRLFLGHDGIFIPECIYFWGDYFSETYGWMPSDQRTDKLQVSRWHKWEWVSELELAYMMIEYYEYTLDKKFLRETALPFANDVLTFFDRQYKTDDNGKLFMQPSQACETWWECTNPMPEIAGLHAVTKALLDLPNELATTQQRSFWQKFQKKIPGLPTREVNGTQMLAPAAKFDRKMNIENPELYAVFPFRLITFRESRKDLALQALYHREDRGNWGWRQEDIVMAYLGLTDSARISVTGRAKNSDKNMRFPAFWGPNYDWTPDQDHGGVLVKALQAMALQTKADSIYLFPAWPKDWNADIRLRAPKKTTINATIKAGRITELHVEPQSRKKDVVTDAAIKR